MEEANLTCALDYFRTLHFNNRRKYLKDAPQSHKAVGLCYYEREQRIKSMILLMRSEIYTKTGIEWCFHNPHIHSHSCMDPKNPLFNYSLPYLLIQSLVYYIFHCLCDLGKKSHVTLIQLNHYKIKILILALQKQICFLLAFNKKITFYTCDTHCHCLMYCCWVLSTWNNH